jgi:hypothetical protein
MARLISFLIITSILSFITQDLFPQYKLDFGNILTEDLLNKPYKPDLGADAIILSDVGTATLNYTNGFYIEFERDMKIRIVNSNGYDYANVEIPFTADDQLVNYRASSFNIRNGEKIETKIDKKNFIIEQVSKYRKTLKFIFPDVHEGTVIEYSYIMRMEGDAVSTLIPWTFQRTIPIVKTSLTLSYPEFFVYKHIISGNPLLVMNQLIKRNQYILGTQTQILNDTWYAVNVPAFREEPIIKSLEENQTKIVFELGSVNYQSYRQEISPTYSTLTKKLLDMEDFGTALKKALFLTKEAEKITKGLNDDLSKLKAVHKYVSEKLFWNGEEDFTASQTPRKTFDDEKGNNADINIILIGMLRGLNIKADPVILSTRSNGSINKVAAMTQQFNYLVANVFANGDNYIVDATDPLRPFNMLPFDCLNGSGRQISEFDSRFIDLKNNEKFEQSEELDLKIDNDLIISGNFKSKNSGYEALSIRKRIKMEGEEGYIQKVKETNSEFELTDLKIQNISARDSDLILSGNILIEESVKKNGNKFLLNPFFSFSTVSNQFISPERSFPVDFGCPIEDSFSASLEIPEDYVITEIPDNVMYNLGNKDGEYVLTCTKNGNRLVINSSLKINKTMFPPEEYLNLRNFYAKVIQTQERLIVFEKRLTR